MNHSPGPWEEKVTDDGLVWVLMPDGHRVSIGDMEETCGICHANARLIAAAPEMLKALELAVNTMGLRHEFRLIIPKLEAAISQATAQ